MPTATRLTVEDFFTCREEMPEDGRWCELIEGRVVQLAPPETLHIGIVFNLAKALGEFVHQTGIGYPCFDLGIVVARNPDTMRLANIAYFLEGPRFEFSDAGYAERPPALVVDVTSSPDRRQTMPQRVREYLARGVREVWILDPETRSAGIHRLAADPQALGPDDRFPSDDLLPGFRCAVGPLFNVPWW